RIAQISWSHSSVASSRQPAADDRNDGTVHVVGSRCEQEDGDIAYILRPTPAAGRDARKDGGTSIGICAQRRGVVGFDIAGRDGVYVDVLGRPFVGQYARDAHDAMLGGRIGSDADAA